MAASEAVRLCALADIPDGASRGFSVARAHGGPLRVFVVRRGLALRAYVNSCPHRGTPLDWVEHEFLDREGLHVICATHGALFNIDDGVCIAGPCAGDQLTPFPLELREGAVWADPDASE